MKGMVYLMKKWFFISTLTCIKKGDVCNVGDVKEFINGKNYQALVEDGKLPMPMPHSSWGYSSRAWAEKAAARDLESRKAFEKSWQESGHNIFWTQTNRVVEVECHS